MVLENSTLEKLQSNPPTFGAWISSVSPRIAEVLGTSGLDWAVIDMEHSPATAHDVEYLVRGFEHYGMTPIVRLPSTDVGLTAACKRALDSGAQGLILPHVETADQAAKMVNAACYPPDGDRGVAGGIRSNDYGSRFDEYVRRVNDELILIAQIESASGIQKVEEIVSMDGINGVLVGRNDLSASYGHAGEKDLKKVEEDIDTVRSIASENQVYSCIVVSSKEQLDRRIDEEFDMISLGSDLSFIKRWVSHMMN